MEGWGSFQQRTAPRTGGRREDPHIICFIYKLWLHSTVLSKSQDRQRWLATQFWHSKAIHRKTTSSPGSSPRQFSKWRLVEFWKVKKALGTWFSCTKRHSSGVLLTKGNVAADFFVNGPINMQGLGVRNVKNRWKCASHRSFISIGQLNRKPLERCS